MASKAATLAGQVSGRSSRDLICSARVMWRLSASKACTSRLAKVGMSGGRVSVMSATSPPSASSVLPMVYFRSCGRIYSLSYDER